MLVDQTRAQEVFDSLPLDMQWPTLSPGYVAADALRDASLRPVFLVAQHDGGLLMHAVHEARIPGREECDWQSAYGYGGPIAQGQNEAGLAQAWRGFADVAAGRGVVVEFVRFHPALGNHRLYPGTVRLDRPVVTVDLEVTDLLASYSGRARTAIRKAQRDGLRATWETTASAQLHFPQFYRRSMSEIGASDFYQFDDTYFDALLGLPGARVLSVMSDDDRLSMGLFLFGPAQVEYHLSGTSPVGRQAGATNLLLHEAARTGQIRDCRTLYLGGGASARADDPLLRFKASFSSPHLSFHIGHQVHDRGVYGQLREAHADQAGPSNRVLFYRS